MYVYVLMAYDLTSAALPASTGLVNVSSNPSGRARISWISNGAFPVHASLSIANGFDPREPQPRLVPPTKSEPALPHRHHAGAEPGTEREARPLIALLDLLQIHAHHRAVRLVAHEELLPERPELAARQVALDPARRLPHLAVGEHHRRRHQLGDLLRLRHHPAAALRHARCLAEVLRLRLLVPAKALGVADEAADRDVLEAAGAVPRPLVVGVEHVAGGVEADAPRRPHAAGGRHPLAALRH